MRSDQEGPRLGLAGARTCFLVRSLAANSPESSILGLTVVRPTSALVPCWQRCSADMPVSRPSCLSPCGRQSTDVHSLSSFQVAPSLLVDSRIKLTPESRLPLGGEDDACSATKRILGVQDHRRQCRCPYQAPKSAPHQ